MRCLFWPDCCSLLRPARGSFTSATQPPSLCVLSPSVFPYQFWFSGIFLPLHLHPWLLCACGSPACIFDGSPCVTILGPLQHSRMGQHSIWETQRAVAGCGAESCVCKVLLCRAQPGAWHTPTAAAPARNALHPWLLACKLSQTKVPVSPESMHPGYELRMGGGNPAAAGSPQLRHDGEVGVRSTMIPVSVD